MPKPGAGQAPQPIAEHAEVRKAAHRRPGVESQQPLESHRETGFLMDLAARCNLQRGVLPLAVSAWELPPACLRVVHEQHVLGASV